MIAHIFYTIFTLMINILTCLLTCFIQKKRKKLWALPPPKHLPGPPPSSPPLAAVIFGFAKNRCTYFFSILSPDILNSSLDKLENYISFAHIGQYHGKVLSFNFSYSAELISTQKTWFHVSHKSHN